MTAQKNYIIICSTSFDEISEQLISYGLEPRTDFCVSPVLNDLKILSDIQSISKSLLITSGNPSTILGKSHGGLYQLDVRGGEWNVKQILSGSCHGIIKKDDFFYVVEDESGIVRLDEEYAIRAKHPVPRGSRAHGLAWSEYSECFYLACSYFDQVLEFSPDFELIRRINVSPKVEQLQTPVHHVNDCVAFGSSIFVSMFSLTGNWKQDVFDGGILEIDIKTGQIVGVIARDLWMPHNVTLKHGGFIVLDSLRGRFLKDNFQEVGVFPGFTRGFHYDNRYSYIGQSKNRNFSKQLGVSKNISIDSGVIIFDDLTKVSRTIQLPHSITEIHGIYCLGQ